MAEHGGYRKPEHPAPASGPGALSRRTDGGPAQSLHKITGLPYGENGALNAEQAAAPLAATPTPGSSGRRKSAPVNPGHNITPFTEPTTQPAVPVTAGAAAGPGPGPEALGLQEPSAASYQTALTTLHSVAAASNSTEVQALLAGLQDRA